MARRKKVKEPKKSEFLACTLDELKERMEPIEQWKSDLFDGKDVVVERNKLAALLTSFNNIAYRLCYEDGGDPTLKLKILGAIEMGLLVELKE